MEKFDIFKSEGGFRLCLALWGDDPIMDDCPWFATNAEAENARLVLKRENDGSKNLYDITGHENGIIVVDSYDVSVCNLEEYADYEIPDVFATYEVDGLEVVSTKRFDDIRKVIPGKIIPISESNYDCECMNIIYDPEDDIPAFFGCGKNAAIYMDGETLLPIDGTLYKLNVWQDGKRKEIKVLTPDIWE